MLREISLEELPERGRFGQELTPDGKFADDTLLEFIDSGIMLAEIEGWPSGDPTSSKQTAKYYSIMQSKIRKHKAKGISVLARGHRIFLQRTAIRKVEN